MLPINFRKEEEKVKLIVGEIRPTAFYSLFPYGCILYPRDEATFDKINYRYQKVSSAQK